MVDEVSEFCELMQNFGQTMCKERKKERKNYRHTMVNLQWKLEIAKNSLEIA